ASTSSAPEARASASGSGKRFGFTSRKSASPMVFIARAAAPMLPGCVVSTSTIRTRSSRSSISHSAAADFTDRGSTGFGFPVFYAALQPPADRRRVPFFQNSRCHMHPMLNIGVRAARRAGDLIVRGMDRLGDLRIETKAGNDFVSEIDRDAERTIIETIRRSYPDHAFIAEESGRTGDAEFEWIIDPLDGTTNFLHGFPVFAVSIA